MDAGCGMGYFTIAMARLAGESGKVLALDLQDKMLQGLKRRAMRAGIEETIEPRLCNPDSLGLDRELDFALAFWMAHETPDQNAFFSEIRRWLKPGGRLLVTEPVFHVTSNDFSRTIEIAVSSGLRIQEPPKVSLSRTALFTA
jgi:ubiquinone/menaquinone biosynthesis C-methylase UbiE